MTWCALCPRLIWANIFWRGKADKFYSTTWHTYDPRLLSLRCPICNFCLSCSCSEQILLRALQSLLSLAPKFATKILPTLLSEKAQFCTAALYNSLLDTRISWLSILFVYLCIPWGFQTSNWHIICHLILLRAQAEKLEMVSLYFLAWKKYRWSNDHPKLYWREQLRTCIQVAVSSIHFLEARFYNQRWSQLIRQLVSGTDGGTVPAVAGPEILNELVWCPNYELISCIMSRPAHKFPIKAYRRVNGNFR